jgi:hypothetical protein
MFLLRHIISVRQLLQRLLCYRGGAVYLFSLAGEVAAWYIPSQLCLDCALRYAHVLMASHNQQTTFYLGVLFTTFRFGLMTPLGRFMEAAICILRLLQNPSGNL